MGQPAGNRRALPARDPAGGGDPRRARGGRWVTGSDCARSTAAPSSRGPHTCQGHRGCCHLLSPRHGLRASGESAVGRARGVLPGRWGHTLRAAFDCGLPGRGSARAPVPGLGSGRCSPMGIWEQSHGGRWPGLGGRPVREAPPPHPRGLDQSRRGVQPGGRLRLEEVPRLPRGRLPLPRASGPGTPGVRRHLSKLRARL